MKRTFWFRLSSILTVFTLAFVLVSCDTEEDDDEDDDDNSDDDDQADDDDSNNNGYTDLSAAEAKQLIDDNPGLNIIDVSPYFDQGHIPGAVNLPIGDGTFDEEVPNLDSVEVYLVYCHGDSPAIEAAEKLVAAGFDMVYRLKGNYQAWVDAGYPVEY